MMTDEKRTFIDPTKQATEKQWAFVRSLADGFLNDADENRAEIARVVLTETTREENSKKSASGLIDMFKAWQQQDREAGRAAKAAKVDAEAPEGIHLESDTVFKVQVAVHGSGKKYAKALNVHTGEWEYMGRGPLSRLSESTLMTLEQAKEFGHVYGMCCRCGRTLTDEGSIAAGIGPVCASKF